MPWSYDGIVRSYLQADKLILDYDTGGGEYLLTLDRDLVEMVLPNTPNPFPHLYLQEQRRAFKDAGFEIIMANEARIVQ